MKHSKFLHSRNGFTLIELLVVISIISVLSSMLLPSLSRAKERTQIIRCIGNLRQLGMGMQMYVNDFGKYPLNRVSDPNDRIVKRTDLAPGGADPIDEVKGYVPSAASRPLYDYVRPSEVYRCARDRGQNYYPTHVYTSRYFTSTKWATIGCSYNYNGALPHYLRGGGFKHNVDDPANGISGKGENWVPQPSKYLLMTEPITSLWPSDLCCSVWYQWHYSRSRSFFTDPRTAPSLFISPVVFVDGHAGSYNFSRSIQSDPYYPYEETKDWVWYKTKNNEPAPKDK